MLLPGPHHGHAGPGRPLRGRINRWAPASPPPSSAASVLKARSAPAYIRTSIMAPALCSAARNRVVAPVARWVSVASRAGRRPPAASPHSPGPFSYMSPGPSQCAQGAAIFSLRKAAFSTHHNPVRAGALNALHAPPLLARRAQALETP
ncbi:hypothetical protein NDU88_003434 [Pleurodeles waltl]|uniref:Uncharacterized protein n=1 Tax=Pleurodeles waltl TaxID=8319 RepID=A0AAV7QC37_PLEWA|nr:hypothetical protein NDU88_003434 [Pleurodeles waltl]